MLCAAFRWHSQEDTVAMRICIDATPIGMRTTDRGGVARYLRSLLTALARSGAAHTYTVYFNLARAQHLPFMRATWAELGLPGNFRPRVTRVPYRLREGLFLPVECTAGPFDVYHGCLDQLPRAWGRRVVTVHDVRYLENLPETAAPSWLGTLRAADPSGALEANYRDRAALFAKLRACARQTLRRADMIITVSEYSKSRLVKLMAVDPARVKVVYHGVDAQLAGAGEPSRPPILERHGLRSGGYVLFVSKFDPLKNQLLLVHVLAQLRRELDTHLVFVGPFNWYYHIVRAEVRALGLKDRVVFTGSVSDVELAVLYRGAALFAFPSLYEGFGLPLIEAMAAGVPVLASDVCSIPELGGDAALYAPPADQLAWAREMTRLLTEERLRLELIRRGHARAREFSWNKTARGTLAVYGSPG